MNNFILNLLGVEDDNVIVDDFFNEKETNTIVITVSLKKKTRGLSIFNENKKPLSIPKLIDKIKYDKIGHFKPRKKDKLK